MKEDLTKTLIIMEPGLWVHWGSYILFHIFDMFQNEKLVTTTKANLFLQDNILVLRIYSLPISITISYLMFYFLEVHLVLAKVNYSLFPIVRCGPQTLRTCIIVSVLQGPTLHHHSKYMVPQSVSFNASHFTMLSILGT